MFNLDPCKNLAEFRRKELRLSASCPLKVIRSGPGLPVRYDQCNPARLQDDELLTLDTREKMLDRVNHLVRVKKPQLPVQQYCLSHSPC